MSGFYEELLTVARLTVNRVTGQRGKMPSARIRRSVSTSYYALFHFLLDDVGRRIVGTRAVLRRRILVRAIAHAGMKLSFDKVAGSQVHSSVSDFFLPAGVTAGTPCPVPPFIQEMAATFSQAQAMRHDADYDLTATIGVYDATALRLRVRSAISAWRAAKSPADRDFKDALYLLILLNGRLKPGA